MLIVFGYVLMIVFNVLGWGLLIILQQLGLFFIPIGHQSKCVFVVHLQCEQLYFGELLA